MTTLLSRACTIFLIANLVGVTIPLRPETPDEAISRAVDIACIALNKKPITHFIIPLRCNAWSPFLSDEDLGPLLAAAEPSIDAVIIIFPEQTKVDSTLTIYYSNGSPKYMTLLPPHVRHYEVKDVKAAKANLPSVSNTCACEFTYSLASLEADDGTPVRTYKIQSQDSSVGPKAKAPM